MMMSECSIGVDGCPVLAFFAGAGKDAADTRFSCLHNPVAHAFQIPALCKVRKGRGTHYVSGASEVKSLGHPPRSAGGGGAGSMSVIA